MSGGTSPSLPLFPAHYFFIRLISSRSETRALTHGSLEGGKLSSTVRPSWTDWREIQRGKWDDSQRAGFSWGPELEVAGSGFSSTCSALHSSSISAPLGMMILQYTKRDLPKSHKEDFKWVTSNKQFCLFYDHSPGQERVLLQLKTPLSRTAVLCSLPILQFCVFLSPSLCLLEKLCQFKELVWLEIKRAGGAEKAGREREKLS